MVTALKIQWGVHKKQHRPFWQPILISGWAAVLHQLAFLHCIGAKYWEIMAGLGDMVV